MSPLGLPGTQPGRVCAGGVARQPHRVARQPGRWAWAVAGLGSSQTRYGGPCLSPMGFTGLEVRLPGAFSKNDDEASPVVLPAPHTFQTRGAFEPKLKAEIGVQSVKRDLSEVKIPFRSISNLQ